MEEQPIRYNPSTFNDVLAKHQPEIAEPAYTLLSKSTGNLNAMATALGELMAQTVTPNAKNNTLEWINKSGRKIVLELEDEEIDAAVEVAELKAAEEAAEAAAEKLAAEEAAAEKAAADEKKAADKKAADEKKAADKKAADEKAVADKKAAEKKAADEKKAAEKKAAEEATAIKKAADKKAAAEMAAAEKAADEAAAAKKAAAETNTNEAETTAENQPEDPIQDTTTEEESSAVQLEGAPGTFFADLAKLTGNTTLILTIAQTGIKDDEPILTVTITPRANTPEAEPFIHPISVQATPAELDESFTTLISSAADGNRGIQAAIRELEAAKAAAADATKLEAAAKKAQANKKTAKSTPEPTLFPAE